MNKYFFSVKDMQNTEETTFLSKRSVLIFSSILYMAISVFTKIYDFCMSSFL